MQRQEGALSRNKYGACRIPAWRRANRARVEKWSTEESRATKFMMAAAGRTHEGWNREPAKLQDMSSHCV